MSLILQGSFVIELYNKHTPHTCYNIAALSNAGYYDNTIIHRINKDVIQGGDPTGTGRGGESIYGQSFDDEILIKQLKFTGAGIVAMANSGPNTNRSQFFITLKPTPYLDGKHTIFGRIYSGMSIIQRMSMVKSDIDERPIHPITIHKTISLRSPPTSSSLSSSSSLLEQAVVVR